MNRALLCLLLSAASTTAFAETPEPNHSRADLETLRTLARECYQDLESSTSGDLVVRVHVGFNGLVTSTLMESRDFDDETLVACVVSTFSDRSLLRHAGGSVHVDYLKFRFGPTSPAGLLFLGSGPTPFGSPELPEQAIVRVAEEQLQPLRWCWRDELRVNPKASVDLTTRFLINDYGTVPWANARRQDDGARLTELEACATTTMKSMVFPGPREYRVAIADYPLEFRPDGSVRAAPSGQRFDLREQPGFLTEGAIHRTVDPGLDAVRGCFRLALRRDPDVGGRVEVDFLIETDGRTEFVAVSRGPDAHSSPFLEQCLIEVFEGFEFPHPNLGGVVQVRYPFRFERPAAAIAKPR